MLTAWCKLEDCNSTAPADKQMNGNVTVNLLRIMYVMSEVL